VGDTASRSTDPAVPAGYPESTADPCRMLRPSCRTRSSDEAAVPGEASPDDAAPLVDTRSNRKSPGDPSGDDTAT